MIVELKLRITGVGVGERVGSADGTCDGLPAEGRVVDFTDGQAEVENIGGCEGRTDGVHEGCILGSKLGTIDGKNDGLCVGLELGPTDGPVLFLQHVTKFLAIPKLL